MTPQLSGQNRGSSPTITKPQQPTIQAGSTKAQQQQNGYFSRKGQDDATPKGKAGSETSLGTSSQAG